MIRNIGAVVAGFLAYGAVCVFVNAVTMKLFSASFHADGTTDSVPLNLFMLFMSFVYAALSGYVTAAAAKGNRMKAVWGLAIVNLTMGIAVQAQYWETMPLWYHIPFLALVIPFVLWGGKLAGRFRKEIGP